MHVKHAALLKLKHAALFLIMQLVLGLIVLRVSIMLRVDLARVRLPLIISLLPKKTAPVFLTQLVCNKSSIFWTRDNFLDPRLFTRDPRHTTRAD